MEIIVKNEVKQQGLKEQGVEHHEIRNNSTRAYDFETIANSQEFKQLMSKKKKFLIPLTGLFLSLYFLLPILTSYTTILNQPAIGSISWTWVYSLGLFIMTWVLCMVYVKKAAQFDKQAQQLMEKYQREGEQNV
jgi:uncharacterized membrane protein (DUF485 family)